jgi:putative FmdB family regulatory protein
MEKLQRINDDPLKECPECSQPSLKKLISAVAFRLKGAGWYETDFKTGSKKNVISESSDSPTESAASQSSPDSSDSGSASKPEATKASTSGSD